MKDEMYTHEQHITARIFVLGQILFKIWGFEIGEMEVEHPVEQKPNKSLNIIHNMTENLSV